MTTTMTPAFATKTSTKDGLKTITTEYAHVNINPERISAIGFIGKSKLHRFNYRFSSEAQLNMHVAKFFGRVHSNKESMKQRREDQKLAAAKFRDTLELGTIYCTSWGYDQTNVDFYQVVETKGQFMILREIHQATTGESHGSMSSHVTAIKDSFVENAEPVRKKIQEHINIDDVRYASVWSGRPQYCSWYA